MNADETRLQTLFTGDIQYAVPYFQRSYSWTRQQWGTLLDDICELYDSPSAQAHFMGSLVLLQQEVDGSQLIIDGQQRLVTLSLLLAALRDAGGLPELNRYLYHHDTTRVLCTQQDRPAFAAVLDGSPNPPFSPITEAHRFLLSAVQQRDSTRLAATVLSQLSFVAITLGRDDNPYRIFESLNAKGMPLTQGDLLRNYFFMRLPREEHDTLFNTTWAPMQSLLGPSFDVFMRDALLRSGEFVRPDEVYQGWRRLLGPAPVEQVKETLQQLAGDAADYDVVLHPERQPSPALQKRLQRLGTWSDTAVHSFRPFLLALYGDYRRGGLSLGSMERVLSAVEAFLVRRLFAGGPPADDNRLFLRLYQQASAEEFPHALTAGEHGWPADAAFVDAAAAYPLFLRSHPDQRRLVLESLEESFPHSRPVTFDRLEIELVAPLLPRPEWLSELGAGEDVHWRLVGTLGNMTWGVRGRSPSLQPTERRKELQELVRYGYELPRDLVGVEHWTADAIQERSRRLAEHALTVWPQP